MQTLGKGAEAKKSATLIRLINHWAEIIGTDMAEHSAPLKITYKQQKNRQTGEQEKFMVLKLKAEGAFAPTIGMRETIILDRINRLFGTEQFRKLDITHGTVSALPSPSSSHSKKVQQHHDLDLPEIDDPILKERLESLGQAVMNSATENKGSNA